MGYQFDRYRITPTSYILALLYGLRLEPEVCRSILAIDKSVPKSSREFWEMIYQLDPNMRKYNCTCHEDADSAIAEGHWWHAESLETGDVICCLDEERYPRSLLDLPDYPLVLFTVGDVSTLSDPKLITIVGTRQPSEYGKKVAFRLGAYYAERGWTTVSGLALGCDTMAHQGCLSLKQPTVAVLAHGLLTMYPPENLKLAKSIVEEGGCLVTEYTKYKTPEKEHFIARDRIQAALSKAVVVVESKVGGGTMYTARSAQKLGRKLGCMSYLPGKSGTQDAKLDGNEYLISTANASRLVDAKDLDAFVSGLEAQDSIQP